MNNEAEWKRFNTYYRVYPNLGLSLDISRMNFPDDFFQTMKVPMEEAFKAMTALEKGALANPDEKRQVGHYWLRAPELAPDPAVREEVEQTLNDIKAFARLVHSGGIAGERGSFTNLLVIGIGGSALGPQFVAHALGNPSEDRVQVHFFDNTDPDGMDRVLAGIGTELGRTLCVVISKSGGTKETYNGMMEARFAYEKAGLSFAKHAVAVTGNGSKLDNIATEEKWLKRFPMWDWVGGRTSETSAVGLLPAALQGFDIDALIEGARKCDEVTRQPSINENPAALLALMWHFIGKGKGAKNMVVLPYKDRLELFSRYLQQLIMESLGKERDLQGKVVHQGLTVFGNKGSTDQHAYVQQLRDGLANFFVNFIEVLHDRSTSSREVDPGETTGDYLFGFFMGTRSALFDKKRQSITITLDQVSPFHVGTLIALYERAVGLYASLININAYHQPGVEAGKVAAGNVIKTQKAIVSFLSGKPDQEFTADQLSGLIKTEEAPHPETIYKTCIHLSRNRRHVQIVDDTCQDPAATRFRYLPT